MRLAVVLALVLLIPTWLVAQHSSGGGSSSGGSSHSSSVFSGGFSGSSHSSMSSLGNSRSSVSSTSSPKTASDARIHAHNAPASVESKKPTHFAFWRHKAAPTNTAPAFAERFPFGCKKGQICTCPGGGARNAAGNCASVQYLSCGLGLSWNNYGCGQQYWFNNCRALSDQLSAVQRQMLGQTGAAVSLRYRLLQDEYERCQHSFHGTLPWLAGLDYN
jgi:hypothetical protein